MDLVDGFWVEYEIGPHTLAIGKEPFLKPSGDGPQLEYGSDFLLFLGESKKNGANR